jgi:hypothetical protein
VSSYITLCTKGAAFRICHSVKEGSGLEAVRLLMQQYELRALVSRAPLKAIIRHNAARTREGLEMTLVHQE